MTKAAVSEIRERFDGDVERFSNVITGQTSVMDAALALEVGTEAVRRLVQNGQTLLDLGCGAGNWTVKLLEKLPNLACTLVDISRPMLERARERVAPLSRQNITILESDFRTVQFEAESFDIITAGATLHHLRDDDEWIAVFTKIYAALRHNGCFLISDLVTHENEILARYDWERWGAYLENAGGPEMRETILTLCEREDTPRPLNWQMELLRRTGFKSIEILHKNACFATFCAIK
ncbi:MAG: class I SAM-dependent methyltransferase [Spirochaetaceae bacterium]|nr:class I SAM-dependent methyltransferase [Spirochaetaceae bacterium]